MTGPGGAPVDAGVVDRYWTALATADRTTAVALALEQVEGGSSVDHVLAHLVSPAQIEVGRRWAANEWNVAQEHAATSISEEVVAALGSRVPTRADRGIAVVTCVEGEWHALPARLLAETLRADGWDVRYLGASLPAAHLSQFLHDVGPDVVALSCSISTSLPRARSMIEASRDGGVPVIAGGRGFGVDGRYAYLLGANGWAPSAAAAVTALAAAEWPRYTERAPDLVPVDTSAERLWDRLAELAAAADVQLEGHLPAMADYGREARARTLEDLEYILDFLAAALYVDDVSLFDEFVGWLDDILLARGVTPEAVAAGLDAVRAVLPPEFPRAAVFLDEVRRTRREERDSARTG